MRENIVEFVDLGRIDYAGALALQRSALERVVAARTEGVSAEVGAELPAGMKVFLVEHVPPVITVTRRPGAAANVIASPERLRAAGVELQETDRGGDVTYHGPGQLVAYPILDLNRLGLRIHGYMRMLEEVVIRTIREFGLEGWRDPKATGVWVGGEVSPDGTRHGGAKICAFGVRVSRWVTMHGLALNVDCDLSHFDLIVPCGLAGRGVTSMRRELGPRCPSMAEVKRTLMRELEEAVTRAISTARASSDA